MAVDHERAPPLPRELQSLFQDDGARALRADAACARDYYGPFFVWRASLTLTRDAWADDGTKTEDDKSNAVKSNELNATVLGAAEALFEIITLATSSTSLLRGVGSCWLVCHRAPASACLCVHGPSPVCA